MFPGDHANRIVKSSRESFHFVFPVGDRRRYGKGATAPPVAHEVVRQFLVWSRPQYNVLFIICSTQRSHIHRKNRALSDLLNDIVLPSPRTEVALFRVK